MVLRVGKSTILKGWGKAIIFLISFLSFSANASENVVLDEFNLRQNEDGSFGSKNKEIVTSIIVNSYQLAGNTPTCRRYGTFVKRSAKMLIARVDTLVEENLDERHFYTLQALSALYWMNGVVALEVSSKKLFKFIHSRMKIRDRWTFERNITKENLPIFIDAIFSLDISQAEDERQHELMTALLQYLQTKRELSNEEVFACGLIKKLWELEGVDLDALSGEKFTLNLESEDHIAVSELALIISSLTDKSQEKREYAFKRCLRLSLSQQKVLLHELENSAISDLNSLAKTFRAHVSVKTPQKEEVSFAKTPLNWLSLYCFHSYSLKERKGRTIQSKAERYLKENRLDLLEWSKISNQPIHEGLTAKENEMVNAAILFNINGAGNFRSIDWRFKHNPMVRFFRESLKQD